MPRQHRTFKIRVASQQDTLRASFIREMRALPDHPGFNTQAEVQTAWATFVREVAEQEDLHHVNWLIERGPGWEAYKALIQ